MSIDAWWPKLDTATQEWLVANNGDAVPAEVVSEIVAAGGAVSSDVGSFGKSDPEGFYLSDETVDWIEATANGETPDL